MKTKANINELLKNVQNGGMSGVYKITRKSDGKVYIGQSICIRHRLEQHIKNENVDENSASIDAAIKKEGADKFTYETIVAIPDLTTEQLWFLEALNIEQYDSYNNGFNKTRGNHRGAYDALDLRNKHKVTEKITKIIEENNNFTLNFRDKKVLLVGNYNRKFIDYIEYQNAVIIAIDAYEKEDFFNKFNEEMRNMENKDFDIVISNPPYGNGIGRKITEKIVDEINYKKFVNILPMTRYIEGNSEIYKHVNLQSVISLDREEFDDAITKASIALIDKRPHLCISKEEFIVESYRIKSLTKYFYKNLERQSETFDVPQQPRFSEDLRNTINPHNTFIIHFRHGEKVNKYKYTVPKDTDKSLSTRWNILKTATFDDLNSFRCGSGRRYMQFTQCKFKSSIDNDNFIKFWNSEDGHGFLHLCMYSMNRSYCHTNEFMPKVDWSKEWTVEEILKDYGYTDKEIKEVMEDLKNFKGMNV